MVDFIQRLGMNTSSSANLVPVPTVVPTDFLGMQCLTALNCGAAVNSVTRNIGYNPPDSTYGSVFTPCFYLSQSAGSYIWSAIDDYCTNFPTQQMVFELGQPPNWMFTRAAIGGAASASGGGTRGNMCPETGVDHLTGANSWQSFITDYATRVAITNGRTGCAWELWNEFDTFAAYGDPISYLGPYAKVTAQAIHAVDPTAIIIAPSISPGNIVNGYTAEDITTFLNASDGASGVAGSWVSQIAYHSYPNFAGGSTDGQYDPPLLVTQLGYVKAAQAAAGFNYPIWMTEGGFTSTEPQQVLDTQRQVLVLAALGVRRYIGFVYDGAPWTLSGIIPQWNALAALLGQQSGGVTITELYVGNKVVATINGTTHVF
jgi:hypothetical protein